MADSDIREVLTREAFGAASRKLAKMVFDSGFQADLILSIARGGLFAAGAVSYALGIKKPARDERGRTDLWINFPWSRLPPFVSGVQAQ